MAAINARSRLQQSRQASAAGEASFFEKRPAAAPKQAAPRATPNKRQQILVYALLGTTTVAVAGTVVAVAFGVWPVAAVLLAVGLLALAAIAWQNRRIKALPASAASSTTAVAPGAASDAASTAAAPVPGPVNQASRRPTPQAPGLQAILAGIYRSTHELAACERAGTTQSARSLVEMIKFKLQDAATFLDKMDDRAAVQHGYTQLALFYNAALTMEVPLLAPVLAELRQALELIEAVRVTELERRSHAPMTDDERAVLAGEAEQLQRHASTSDGRDRASKIVARVPPPVHSDGIATKRAANVHVLRQLGLPQGFVVRELMSKRGARYFITATQRRGESGKFRYAIDAFGVAWAIKEFRSEDAPKKSVTGKDKRGKAYTGVTGKAARNKELQTLRDASDLVVRDLITINGKDYAVMTLMDGEVYDLLTKLSGNRAANYKQVVRDTYKKMAANLGKVHARGFLHGDVKYQNALWDKFGNVVMGDFGASERLNATGHAPAQLRSTYPAPEMVALRAVTSAADVWSLGATFGDAYVHSGENPFGHHLDHVPSKIPVWRQGEMAAWNAARASDKEAGFAAWRAQNFAAWRTQLIGPDGSVDVRRMPANSLYTRYFSGIAQADPTLCAYVIFAMLNPDPAQRAKAAQVAQFIAGRATAEESQNVHAVYADEVANGLTQKILDDLKTYQRWATQKETAAV